MERRWLGPESPLRPIAECRFYREGDWSFLVHPEIWSQGLWTEVLKHLGGQVRSHHPQTKRLHYPAGDSGREFYLKIYHRPDPLGTIKDLFRNSKAFLALRQAMPWTPRWFPSGGQQGRRERVRTNLRIWPSGGRPNVPRVTSNSAPLDGSVCSLSK